MNRSLDDKHRAELRASGISDATMEAAGIHSIRDGEIATILGWQPRNCSWGAGWTIPFRSGNETTAV